MFRDYLAGQHCKTMTSLYKIATARTPGRSHIEKNTPCQDFVGRLKLHGVISIALSDGAGSKSNSHIGSTITVKKTLQYICRNFDLLYESSSADISHLIVNHVYKSLIKDAEKSNLPVKEYAATLLFVAIKNDKYFYGHLGDGILGIYHNSSFPIISVPENGEFINVTHFITDSDAPKYLRIEKGKLLINNVSGFILMSDGSAESLFNKQTKQLGNGCHVLLKWLQEVSESKMRNILKQNLEKIISQKTLDDCSIGILTVRNY